ncbi:tail fiber assembly protein [Pseudomonas parasichuanensis]|uniref:tail fiber assembly protein n=1 Tax=Pseudomonas parasichuanensis TaxID=2892329 RepID=UPI001F4534DF|nr:tail fiber assembly protein [Pseudomonas parasichuanensis]
MSYYYSKLLNAFLDDSLRDVYEQAGNWPEDCVQASDEVFQEFAITPAPVGKVRAGGADGLPAWIDAPAPSHEQLVAEASAEKTYRMQIAAAMVAPLQDAVDLGDAADSEKVLLTSWKQYRVALNRIELQAEYPAQIEWPVAPSDG